MRLGGDDEVDLHVDISNAWFVQLLLLQLQIGVAQCLAWILEA